MFSKKCSQLNRKMSSPSSEGSLPPRLRHYPRSATLLELPAAPAGTGSIAANLRLPPQSLRRSGSSAQQPLNVGPVFRFTGFDTHDDLPTVLVAEQYDLLPFRERLNPHYGWTL